MGECISVFSGGAFSTDTFFVLVGRWTRLVIVPRGGRATDGLSRLGQGKSEGILDKEWRVVWCRRSLTVRSIPTLVVSNWLLRARTSSSSRNSSDSWLSYPIVHWSVGRSLPIYYRSVDAGWIREDSHRSSTDSCWLLDWDDCAI